MINDITKAFRVRDGISFDGDVFIFTGDVKPPSDEIPVAPAGSLYLYANDSEAALYQSNGTEWTQSGDGGGSDPGWVIYNPFERPVFTVQGVYESHWLENDPDGYYFTLSHPASIEFGGVSGNLYEVGSNHKIDGIDVEDLDDDDPRSTNSFPALYSLSPGYYRIRPQRWGDLVIILHRHEHAVSSWPATTWQNSETHTNDIFTWHSGSEYPWI